MTTDAQGTVERMLGEGTSFENNTSRRWRFPSEQLSALWLLAWAEATDPVARRRVVAEAPAPMVFHGPRTRSPRRAPRTTSVGSYRFRAFVRILNAGLAAPARVGLSLIHVRSNLLVPDPDAVAFPAGIYFRRTLSFPPAGAGA